MNQYTRLEKVHELVTDGTDSDDDLTSGLQNHEQEEGGATHQDIVQFASSMRVALCTDEVVEVDIIRIGNFKDRVSFTAKTYPHSALPDEQYKHVEEVIVMEDGQSAHTIHVPIIGGPEWHPTLEFNIKLENENGCRLGKSLKSMRVKVVDDSVFPTDKWREQVLNGDDPINGIPSLDQKPLGVFMSFIYLMMNMNMKGTNDENKQGWLSIKWRTIVYIFVDQLRNVYAYMRLVLSVYLVDVVVGPHTERLIFPEDRVKTAYAVAVLIAAPMFILFAIEHLKIRLDIHGRLRRDLSRCCFRTFLNYTHQSQEEVNQTDMLEIITDGCESATEGYMILLEVFQVMGKLGLSIYFTLSHNFSVWWAVVAVPTVLLLWANLRTRVFIDASGAAGDEESSLMAYVHQVLHHLPLWQQYGQRNLADDVFDSKSEELRKANIPVKSVCATSAFLPKLMAPLMIATYMIIAVQMVVDKHIKLGVFLATISVFGDICGSFESLFSHVEGITGKFGDVLGLTDVLNKARDVLQWKDVQDKRKHMTKELRNSHLHEHFPEDAKPAIDKLKISVEDLNFARKVPNEEIRTDGTKEEEIHNEFETLSLKNVQMFGNVYLECDQGSIIKIISGYGTTTFMQLLAHQFFPPRDDSTQNFGIFIPSHLKMLFVPEQPVLLNMSLWDNLVFGRVKDHNPHRVEKILEFLKMDWLLAAIQEETIKRKKAYNERGGQPTEGLHVHNISTGINPLEKYRSSHKKAIAIARAFIANPNVLVMNRPFRHMHDAGRKKILADAIERHRDSRGLEEEGDASSRRPRTVFYSSIPRLRNGEEEEEPSLTDAIGLTVDAAWRMPKQREDPWRIVTKKGRFKSMIKTQMTED
jgi:ABC-type multidrug transport system fused ATPase/permease subunit